MSEILKVKSLSKVYGSKTNALTVLSDINFSVLKGESVAIIGPSGSGKTTLLGLCAGLDRVTEGEVVLNHISLNELNEDELAQVRNQNIGFVFQNFQLIPTLTALENVQVPLELRGVKNTMEPSIALLERVGLGAGKIITPRNYLEANSNASPLPEPFQIILKSFLPMSPRET